MKVKEILDALAEKDPNTLVIVRGGDSLNVWENPVGSFDIVSYCEAHEDIIGYTYAVDLEGERKKCERCLFAVADLCGKTDGVGNYMRHALLVTHGEKRCGVPCYDDAIKVMDGRGINWMTGKPKP